MRCRSSRRDRPWGCAALADVRVYLSKNESENHVLRSFYDGCSGSKTLTTLDDYKPSDIAVIFGTFKKNVPISIPRGRVEEKQRIRGLQTINLETGYINRGAGPDNYYAAGWNGINGRADFRNRGMPADRAARWSMADWREGETVMLCGQVPWDASVDFSNHLKWLIEAAAILQALTRREIVFRPHPLAKIPNLLGCTYSWGVPIEDELTRAHCVVTFNSNSGVDAILAGVPVFAFDIGSMVYSLASKNWATLEAPRKPDRTQWLNDISYAQWTPQEMANGQTWRHLSSSNFLSESMREKAS